MKPFMPKRVFFDKEALEFPLGKILYDFFRKEGIETTRTAKGNRVIGIPGDSPQSKYFEGKRSLVVSVRKDLEFVSCRPSADFSFPLVSGCTGGCQYCYLQTQFGDKPYIRIYVNTDEILQAVKEVIDESAPKKITSFEAASTSDPLSVEHFTGSLAKAIEFFGEQEYGRLRFVTKFSRVDSLLNLKHNDHTRFRFSINSDYVIKHFEHNTASLQERVEAAGKVAHAGYPMGFIIAPLMIYKGWKEEYKYLLDSLREQMAGAPQKDLTFELIQFRFTKASKNRMLERFPNTKLDLDQDKRRIKYGRYGIKKWLYPKNQAAMIENHLSDLIKEFFPEAQIAYFT